MLRLTAQLLHLLDSGQIHLLDFALGVACRPNRFPWLSSCDLACSSLRAFARAMWSIFPFTAGRLSPSWLVRPLLTCPPQAFPEHPMQNGPAPPQSLASTRCPLLLALLTTPEYGLLAHLPSRRGGCVQAEARIAHSASTVCVAGQWWMENTSSL